MVRKCLYAKLGLNSFNFVVRYSIMWALFVLLFLMYNIFKLVRENCIFHKLIQRELLLVKQVNISAFQQNSVKHHCLSPLQYIWPSLTQIFRGYISFYTLFVCYPNNSKNVLIRIPIFHGIRLVINMRELMVSYLRIDRQRLLASHVNNQWDAAKRIFQIIFVEYPR